MALASTDDIETRLGRGPLSDRQTAQAALLLEGADAVIANAAGVAIANLPTDAPLLRFVAIELVCRAMANPDGVDSTREQLGAYSHAADFREAGLLLTDDEEKLIRVAVTGRSSGSAYVRSLVDDALDLMDDGEINDSLGS